ncbi:MAG TPA: hypothetical protein VLN73_02520, partial [Alphaproteobacteria bacterium]|nr:hypothetical protein [Alphaproteobacteria bacterium]
IFGTTLIAARVLETAHYISDALFGTYLGIALTAYLWAVFERSGVDFEAAKAGRLSKGEKLPWPERLGLPGWLMRVFRPAAAKSRKALSADPS